MLRALTFCYRWAAYACCVLFGMVYLGPDWRMEYRHFYKAHIWGRAEFDDEDEEDRRRLGL